MNAGTVVSKAELNIRPFKRDMDRMKMEGVRGSAQVDRSFSRMSRNVGMAASAAAAAMGAMFVGITGAAIQQAAEFDALRFSMNKLNGSAEEGARNFERLKKFSAGTPFQLQDLVKANNIIMGMGLSADDTFTSLQRLGDIAAVSGANINELAVTFGQAAAEGKLMTRDIREFINRGIPLTALLADSMGVAKDEIFELASQSKITFDVLQQALKDATTGTGMYANATEEASKRINGSFSTLKDNTSMLLAAYGDLIVESTDLNGITRDLSGRISLLTDSISNAEVPTSQLADEFRGWYTIMVSIPDAITSINTKTDGLNRALSGIVTLGASEGVNWLIDWARESVREIGKAQRQFSIFGDNLKDILDATNEWSMTSNIVDTTEAVNKLKNSLDFLNTLEGIKTIEQADISKPFIEAEQPTYNMAQHLMDAHSNLNKIMNLPSDDILPVQEFKDISATAERLNQQLEFFAMMDGIKNINTDMKEGTEAARMFTSTLADGMEDAIFNGGSLRDVLNDIIRQLASRALTAGIFSLLAGPAVSFGSAFFGGMRHTGGVVPGAGERTMTLKGGEGVFTAGQMRALGGMINRPSGGISAGAMEKAFDMALSKHTSRLSPDDFLVMTREGDRLEGRLR